MPGFTSRDDIINEATTNGKQDVWNFYKNAPNAAQGAGVWQALLKGNGNPGVGVDGATTPGTAFTSTPAAPNAGAMYFPDRSTDQKYLLSFGACATQNCTLSLYDRLVSVGTVSLTTTGTRTISSVAVPRYATTAAINNDVWLTMDTASTTTAAQVNLLTYTSADGTTGQVGPALVMPNAVMPLNSMVQMPLSAAKQGVRSVETINVGTATTLGVVNVAIIRTIARIPLLANIWNEVSFLDDVMGLPRIYDGATLGLMILPSVTTAVSVWGTLNVVYG
jgi:hypothetical protein